MLNQILASYLLCILSYSMSVGEELIQHPFFSHMSTHVCVQAEMEMESLVMARKQLVQQWSSSLMGIGRRDEAFSAMQEALR